MRRLREVTLHIGIMLLAVACSDSAAPGAATYLRATVDGVPFSGDEMQGVGPNGDHMLFSGQDATGGVTRRVSLRILHMKGPGTYHISPGSSSRASYAETSSETGGGTWIADSTCGSGTITIVDIDGDYISGSFEFLGFREFQRSMDSRTVSGEFLLRRSVGGGAGGRGMQSGPGGRGGPPPPSPCAT